MTIHDRSQHRLHHHGRRGLLGAALAAALVAGVTLSGSAPASAGTTVTASSVANAYAFLDTMMDKYATGSTTRLVQSFVPDKAMGHSPIRSPTTTPW